MKKDQSFHDYCVKDLLNVFTGITSRAMFGGWGIYKDGLIFAIIADGQLYFKADGKNSLEFKKLGSKPFVYSQGNHKPTTMSYWLVPEDILENHLKLEEWVQLAIEASKRKKNAK